MESPGGPRVVIIGAGFSGLCLGIQLQKAGLHSFTILEKAEGLGGTWRDNTYPGCACDSPSFAYCFSFEQKTDWSRKWAPQPEILGYLEHCARKYGLWPHIRLETEVEAARFDAEAAVWRIRTRQGEELEAEVLVSGVGQLNRPSVPDIPGLSRFRGECFHSARWNRACELRGKRVAVIGNAASAVQLVPELAGRAARLLVFQRSANWMLPKGDRPYSEREKRLFGRLPLLARLYRWWIWAQFEARWPLFKRNAFLERRVAALAEAHLRRQIPDPELADRLVPDYPVGGKRILISDDYYPALARDDVELVSEGIRELSEDAVVTRDGTRHPVDVVVLATGFETTSFLAPMSVQGLNGRLLEQEWKDGAEAFLGISVPGFPNFFMTYGPNTNLGHNSIIFMLECQTGYIVRCIQALKRRGLAWLDLRSDAMRAYNRRLRAELERTVWAATEHSWYKTADGRITNNWSGSTIRYWWRTRRPDLSAYRQVPKRRTAERPVPEGRARPGAP